MEILIERLVHRGLGLGRVNGRVWLVPLAAPGDRVRVRIADERRDVVHGEILEVIEPGPDRVEPPCPVYGRCGGCQIQHIDPERQSDLKARILVETLRRIGRIDCPEPVIVRGNPWNWRGRIELHQGKGTAGGPGLGFFARASRDLVEPGECLIADARASRLIEPLRRTIVARGRPDPGTIEPVVGSDGSVVVVLRGAGDSATKLGRSIRNLPGITGVISGKDTSRGTEWTVEGQDRVTWPTAAPGGGSLQLSLDPRGFSQANRDLNPEFVRTVLSMAACEKGTRVVELYAGAGNLTLPLALSGASVTALEVNAPALEEARLTLGSHGVQGRVMTGPVWKGIDRLVRAGDQFDLLIADPPRTGMEGDAGAAARLGAARVVLCSCEPSTLARDLRPFLDAGYTLQRSALVDMFPQTWHMETVLLLARESQAL